MNAQLVSIERFDLSELEKIVLFSAGTNCLIRNNPNTAREHCNAVRNDCLTRLAITSVGFPPFSRVSSMDPTSTGQPTDRIGLAIRIVTGYLSNNPVQAAEVPMLIRGVHAALGSLTRPEAASAHAPDKATRTQIRRSITPDALISFIDGKPYKSLKRHLTVHGLEARSYRERFGLPEDYPMVAPSYSERRSAIARGLSLGRKAGSVQSGGDTEASGAANGYQSLDAGQDQIGRQYAPADV
ncbi:MucR family transcriptional regulator [uncultured Methylobacterium sp.]|uniref:MucR family transcriptional regulator n=1 Tax=uncultured Methylobacterium sp. TaxID=157278 RepID=UPI00338E51AF